MIREVEKLSKYNIEVNNPFMHIVVFEDNKIIKGYLEYNILYDRIDICNLYVEENYRRSHIASNLIEYLIDLCAKENLINISLEVKSTNLPAIALYEKYGFVKKAIRKGYYKGIDGFLYVKEMMKNE